MKYCLICLLVLLGATFPLLVNPQDSHVHSEYIKDIKKTKVTTDLMYVVNAPAQFMQVTVIVSLSRRKACKATQYNNLTHMVLFRAWRCNL